MAVNYADLVIPGITDLGTLACISRSRKYNQYCLMVDNALKGECPFCKLDPQKNVVLVENVYWRAWQSPAPEDNTKHHFVLATHFHHKSMRELDSAAKLAWFSVMEKLQDIHRYDASGILIRDGNAVLSAGTIEHLHTHVMVPNGEGRVESPFYKGDEAEAKSLARAIVFEKMRQGAPLLDADRQRIA